MRLLVYEYEQDDPKRCTSAKLRKFQLARKLWSLMNIRPRSIVLNPSSNTPLSHQDCSIVEAHGIVALDCSWNLSQGIFAREFPGDNRRLPLLLAGNPTNYGALGKLSTAEAFAGALYITGHELQAKRLLSLFKWGATFLSLNQELLDNYSRSSKEELLSEENEYFGSRRG